MISFADNGDLSNWKGAFTKNPDFFRPFDPHFDGPFATERGTNKVSFALVDYVTTKAFGMMNNGKRIGMISLYLFL